MGTYVDTCTVLYVMTILVQGKAVLDSACPYAKKISLLVTWSDCNSNEWSLSCEGREVQKSEKNLKTCKKKKFKCKNSLEIEVSLEGKNIHF